MLGFMIGFALVYYWLSKPSALAVVPDPNRPGEWTVRGNARKLAPSDRDKIILLLQNEINQLRPGTKYDVN